MHYLIAEAGDMESLEMQVNHAISLGATLQGGISFAQVYAPLFDEWEERYVQAMLIPKELFTEVSVAASVKPEIKKPRGRSRRGGAKKRN